jgi:putative nucleotidyltransferase with HDIG domain
MTVEEEKYIKYVFPFVEKIRDDGLKDGVIKVWLRLWRESGYSTLEEAPMRGPVQDTLVKHTNAVTNAALALANQFQEEYGFPVNLDILLAGALLHDVDKLVIFKKKAGNIEFSDMGKKLPHGSYGGHVALELGLPMEVAHLIFTHSLACTWDPVTIEGIFLHHADFAKIDAVNLASGWKAP